MIKRRVPHGIPTILNGRRNPAYSRAYYFLNRKITLSYSKTWKAANPDRVRSYRHPEYLRQKAKIRKAVFDAYGRVCQCCGETEEAFLCIDHVNGGGNKHRRAIGRGKNPRTGLGFYLWLIQRHFPKGFQTLCHNCNMSKAFHGICPHQKKREQYGDSNTTIDAGR